MRIGIDIKCLRTNNSGIGRYTRNILDALQKIDNTNDYVLFSPSPIDYALNNPRWRSVVASTKLPGILWQQQVLPGILKQEKIDLIWGPEQTIPVKGLGKIKSVLTVHDFVYKRFPKTMRKSVLWINKAFGSRSIKKASAIVPVSDFTQSELFHFYPKIDREKVVVVNCGVNGEKHFGEDCIKNYGENCAGENSISATIRKKQLLFVGSLEPRKNLPTLIHALEILKHKGVVVPLVLTGPKGWKNKNFKTLMQCTSVADQICHKGYVSDQELSELYKESAAVVFPSVYEGFGLPALEALSRNTPVLTSKGSVMETVLGDCGWYFDATSAKSIASAVENFWSGLDHEGFAKVSMDFEDKRQTLLARYTWENSARKLMGVFWKVCHG